MAITPRSAPHVAELGDWFAKLFIFALAPNISAVSTLKASVRKLCALTQACARQDDSTLSSEVPSLVSFAFPSSFQTVKPLF
jgi:hypothetical protein